MPNKRPLIAYIEDDGMLMTMYKTLFIEHGFDFVGAKDFSSGEKMIKAKKPDLLLLDLLLPDKSKWIPTDLDVELGLQILKDLKSDSGTRDIPVIILSNIDESDVIKEAKKQGAEDYMVKANVLPKQVLAKVRDILGKRGIELPCDPIKEKCE